MWGKIGEFVCANWLNILLVVVGASAFFVYWAQERRKISEAASLIIMQIEDLQKRIREIGSYISEGILNDSAFYESQILFKTDYWNQYKHYFIRKLDSFSFNTIDEFYNCATEILEQQELMKSLQKNYFFYTQQMIIQMEGIAVLQALNSSTQNPADFSAAVNGLIATIPNGMSAEQKQAVENLLKQVSFVNRNRDYDQFWSLYNKEKQDITAAVNRGALDRYTPMQIRISIENALKKLNSISVIGCEGYVKMKKMAGRKI
ncbi:hypothetical protein [Gemmiger sp. An194]|uniref:hypothetical protein n=1 Tax=Gemmiger sp. An194 TaxID=1965582 RepID=UPI000B39C8AB|nr:hypothetical protein [Gemmiger sp. An194]OUP23424.1 hypothetical protein B5F28_11410 [Gemmiger sp. An194]